MAQRRTVAGPTAVGRPGRDGSFCGPVPRCAAATGAFAHASSRPDSREDVVLPGATRRLRRRDQSGAQRFRQAQHPGAPGEGPLDCGRRPGLGVRSVRHAARRSRPFSAIRTRRLPTRGTFLFGWLLSRRRHSAGWVARAGPSRRFGGVMRSSDPGIAARRRHIGTLRTGASDRRRPRPAKLLKPYFAKLTRKRVDNSRSLRWWPSTGLLTNRSLAVTCHPSHFFTAVTMVKSKLARYWPVSVRFG